MLLQPHPAVRCDGWAGEGWPIAPSAAAWTSKAGSTSPAARARHPSRFWAPRVRRLRTAAAHADSVAATAVAAAPPLHFARPHGDASPYLAYRCKPESRLAPSYISSAPRLLPSCAASHVSRMLSKTPGQHRIRQSCFPTSSASGKCMTKTATAMTPQTATGFTPQTALVTHSLRGAHLPLQALAQCSAHMVR